MKTRQEVEQLKQCWIKDPIWDIYDTEGYEEYKDELRVFQTNMMQEWRAREYNKVYDYARTLSIETLGNPADEPNLELAKLLMQIEKRLTQIENKD